MVSLPILLVCALATCNKAAASQSTYDIASFLQNSVQTHRAETDVSADYLTGRENLEVLTAGNSIKPHKLGPMAYTRLGPIMGVDEGTHFCFKGIPYVETPERFEVAQPKKPWAPRIFNATSFRKACIGARTDSEDEDCLHLNIWASKGGHKDMPVIVYIHGGVNQHGSGAEYLRRGDGMATSAKYPTVFVNFDFRLGIFGWIALEGSNITENLGLLDQQAALRWVQQNIAAFGGDPARVTLQSQSEGGSAILNHMVAPGSNGLFHRAALHSPPADMWSRSANAAHTKNIIEKTQCQRPLTWSTVRCLQRKKAQGLWKADWGADELSRHVFSRSWFASVYGLLEFHLKSNAKDETPGMLGWHPVVDNVTLFGEPRDLIRQGHFNNVSVLITMTLNESLGVLPGGDELGCNLGLRYLLKEGDKDRVEDLYQSTMEAQGIRTRNKKDLLNQMITDKIWTCDIRTLAADLTLGGSRTYVGMFAHAPRYAAAGKTTSSECDQGAACHADDMLYLMPQLRNRGIHGKGMERELEFSQRYRDSVLAFVHGNDTDHAWVPYNVDSQPIVFYKANETFLVPRYRKEQCDILDASMGEHLPAFMRRVTQL